ncbi:MAG: YceI family protein [Planctomycetota bacterium]|jgi:polyisoprenoid-binding protein YceI
MSILSRFALIALATAGAAAPAAEFTVDTGHSSAIWGIHHLGLGNVYGRFNDIGGSVDWDAANPGASSVSISIKTASIDSAVKKRDDHLRNADFFDAGTYPTMTFTGSGFSPVAGKADTFTVSGELTIKGVTKPITVEVVKTGEGEHFMAKKPAVGFETRFTINRRDFDVIGGTVAAAVADQVSIIIAVEGIAQ